MDKLTAQAPGTSPDHGAGGNLARLRGLFPEAFLDGKVDFEVLRQLLGDPVEAGEEKFGFSWFGKRRARQRALTPSAGTLRPCPPDGEDSRNLVIEGDNLEVLKLLQKSYCGKVDMIFIDPPYNTGKDFVYPDDFSDTIKNYLELTGQVESGTRTSSNVESSGRFHTDWLDMIYPRLRLARQLLAERGMIFISINDKEVHHLRCICDELFGEENFVECYIWNSTFRPDNSSRICRKNAEFILCYAKRIECLGELVGERIARTGLPSLTKSSMAASTLRFPENAVDCLLPDGRYRKGVKGSYELLDDVTVLAGKNANAFRLTGPVIWGQENLLRELAAGTRIIIKTEAFVPDVDKGGQGTLRPAKIIPSERVADVLAANAENRELLGAAVFDYPKPVSLIKYLIGFRKENQLVLDFFAGSGTTGHAVMAANAEDGGSRRFILVQLPEFLDAANPDQAEAAAFCARHGLPTRLTELTKLRLRRAGETYRASGSKADHGFRVLRLDASNLRPWDGRSGDLAETLRAAVDPIREGRTGPDVLFELLLKLGVELTVAIEPKEIAGKTVHCAGAGALMACLEGPIGREDCEALGEGIAAWRRELAPAGATALVFRDGAFADDVAKVNLIAVLGRHGLDNVRCL